MNKEKLMKLLRPSGRTVLMTDLKVMIRSVKAVKHSQPGIMRAICYKHFNAFSRSRFLLLLPSGR